MPPLLLQRHSPDQQLNMKQDGLYTMIFDFVNERYYIKKYMVIYKSRSAWQDRPDLHQL